MENEIKKMQEEVNKRTLVEEKALNLMAELKFTEANELLNTLNESDKVLKKMLV